MADDDDDGDDEEERDEVKLLDYLADPITIQMIAIP
jgi:hypothetical protein